MAQLRERLLHLENVIHHQLVEHSIAMLRVAVGAVFLGFGVLKYFPGVSPAENLTQATTHILFFGLVPGGLSIVAVATLECFIGACLIAGRFMRAAIWLLAIEFVGILAPLVLLPGRLFAGPHHAPTLEGQYVLKDVILAGAAMVIAAATFRGDAWSVTMSGLDRWLRSRRRRTASKSFASCLRAPAIASGSHGCASCTGYRSRNSMTGRKSPGPAPETPSTRRRWPGLRHGQCCTRRQIHRAGAGM